MMNWVEEFLVVLAYSKRTQWAIGLGIASFVVILATADYFAGHLSLQGGALCPMLYAKQFWVDTTRRLGLLWVHS